MSDIEFDNFVLNEAATNLNASASSEATGFFRVLNNISYDPNAAKQPWLNVSGDVNHLQNNDPSFWSSQITFPHLNSWLHPAPIAPSATQFQNDIDMGLAPEDITLPNPVKGSASLKCQFSDCSEADAFPSKSELDKHIERKHTKPHLCHVPNCKHPRFGDKAGLDRHKREVHSSQSFPCPMKSCKRHIKPFHRLYNVSDHIKRCHPQANRVRTTLAPRPAAINYRQSEEGSEDTVEAASADSVVNEFSGEFVEGGNQGRQLRQKLNMLRAKKEAMNAEIDADIQALERAVEILERS